MTGITKPSVGPCPKLTIFYRRLANRNKRKVIIVNKYSSSHQAHNFQVTHFPMY